MDLNQILTFALVAFLLVITPGPNGVLIAKTLPSSGRIAAFSNIAGFFVAMFLHGALSILGISLILVKSAEAFFLLKLLGALYLCWIGLKALLDAVKPMSATATVLPGQSRRTLSKAFMEGFFSNLFNPKVSMFYLAAFPQFIPAGQGAVFSSFILVFIHALINVCWFTFIVMLFSKLTGAIRKGQFQRWIKAITGVIFLGFGAKMMTLKA